MTRLPCICFGLVLATGLFSWDCDGAARCYNEHLRPPCSEENDATMEENTSGSDIVEAVLEKLKCLRAFSCDQMLMQRIAFAESEYGEIENCGGGIWGLDRETFDRLSDHQDMLQDTTDIICNRSGISFFDDVKYEFLNIPFYSGLAARLYLHYLERTNVKVPFKGIIEKQGTFWVHHYHRRNIIAEAAANETFVNKSKNIDFKCTVNADILFLLDTSGSIGKNKFSLVRTFLSNFVKVLKIGPKDDQVGVITFADKAEVTFPLNQHNNQKDLNDSINDNNILTYSQGNTNLAEGLCRLREEFENGARPVSAGEVFRVAIVMSDGKPNHYNIDCRQTNTSYAQEATQLHNLQPKVGVYVIGVTDSITDEVLEATASNPTCEYVSHIDDFNPLTAIGRWYLYEICKRASIEIEVNETVNGTLDLDENSRCHLPISSIGITVKVCVSEGRVKVYGSISIPNPNSALYSWMFEVEHGPQKPGTQTCLSYFMTTIITTSPEASPSEVTTPSEMTQRSRFVRSSGGTPPSEATTSSTFDPNTLTGQTLYISVIGMEEHNTYSLDGTSGNNCDEAHTQCVQDDPPTNNSPTTTTSTPHNTTSLDPVADSKVSVIVAVTISGLVLVILCILIVLLVNICYVNRKKKSKQEDEQSLMSENIEYVSF